MKLQNTKISKRLTKFREVPITQHNDISWQSYIFLQLFDFDIEVKPILEVLVGKTIEQALMEVMEEEELANLRAQQVTA